MPTLKFGLFSMNSGPCSYPEGAVRIARLAEEAGFDSLWAGEHVVVPALQPRCGRGGPVWYRDR